MDLSAGCKSQQVIFAQSCGVAAASSLCRTVYTTSQALHGDSATHLTDFQISKLRSQISTET